MSSLFTSPFLRSSAYLASTCQQLQLSATTKPLGIAEQHYLFSLLVSWWTSMCLHTVLQSILSCSTQHATQQASSCWEAGLRPWKHGTKCSDSDNSDLVPPFSLLIQVLA